MKSSNVIDRGFFGWSVAISDSHLIPGTGDGNTIVVGAQGESGGATGVNGDQKKVGGEASGAAYVFVRNGGTWSQQAYLKASNAEGLNIPPGPGDFAGDLFGYSVAVSQNTIVVGAPLEDSKATGVNGDQLNNNATNSGAAYIFVRNGTSWSQQAYLKASNTGAKDKFNEAGDVFGITVAIDGNTVVVGAPNEDSNAVGVNGNQSDNSAEESGAAYVFVRNQGTWSQQAYLKASNAAAGDGFGEAVAISGNRVVVGASTEDSKSTAVNTLQSDNSAFASGAAYIFTRNGTTWEQQQIYLKASNTGALNHFGQAVAISGSFIVIGAPDESSKATGVGGNQADNSMTDAGAAYIFAFPTSFSFPQK